MTDLEPGGPYTLDRTMKAARQMSEAARYLNHATQDVRSDALIYPSDLDRLVAELETVAQRMPQLLSQIADRIAADAKAGYLEVVSGPHKGKPGDAAMWARIEADRAAARFGAARQSLEALHQITSAIAAAEPAGD